MKILAAIVVILVVLLGALWLKFRGPDIPYAVLESEYAVSNSHFVDLDGGFHVHYIDDGDPALPLLVLLHGFGDSHTSWEGWVRVLRGRYRLISVDFPGHGLTRAPAGTSLSGAGLADFIDAFAAKLALPKFAVAGNSMGGAVAWQVAVRHPQRIDALVLVDAAGFANDKPPGETPLAFKILRYRAGRALLRNIDNRPLIEMSLKFDVFEQALITPALVDRWAKFQRAPGHRAILMNVDLGGLSEAAAAPLHDIAVPTLILWGESDPLIEPASAYKFAAAIPGAKVVTYPKVGHLPQLEIPARSAAAVADFLDGHPT